MSQIHPTAIVDDGVEIGRDCTIHAYAILRRGTVLGERVTVHPFAVVGGDPQDLILQRLVLGAQGQQFFGRGVRDFVELFGRRLIVGHLLILYVFVTWDRTRAV